MKKRDKMLIPDKFSVLRLMAGSILFFTLISLFGCSTETDNATQKLETSISSQAYEEFRLGNLAKSQDNYQVARNHFDRAVELDPGNTLYLNGAAFFEYSMNEFDKAIQYFEKVLALDLDASLGPDNPNVPEDWYNLGEVWSQKGNYDKAIEYYGKAVDNWRKNLGDAHPNLVSGWNYLGEAR